MFLVNNACYRMNVFRTVTKRLELWTEKFEENVQDICNQENNLWTTDFRKQEKGKKIKKNWQQIIERFVNMEEKLKSVATVIRDYIEFETEVRIRSYPHQRRHWIWNRSQKLWWHSTEKTHTELGTEAINL